MHDEETGQYVARCDELGISSFGPTIEAAFEALDDAILLYLNTLDEVGERDRTFEERGIRIIAGSGHMTETAFRARPEEIVSPRELPVPIPA
jgi:predicted RNase H-like HicB family nuclease